MIMIAGKNVLRSPNTIKLKHLASRSLTNSLFPRDKTRIKTSLSILLDEDKGIPVSIP
jgi:hypothetical protein